MFLFLYKEDNSNIFRCMPLIKYGGVAAIQDMCQVIDKKWLFIGCCLFNKLEEAKWLYSSDSDINYIYNSDNVLPKNPFVICCTNGSLEFAKWIYSFAKSDINTLILNGAFIGSCDGNKWEIAKWLYSLGNVNITIDAFTSCCTNGSLEFAKWIYDFVKGDVDTAVLNKAFIGCCTKNKWEIANWLYSFDNNVIHADDDKPFRSSMSNDDLKIAKWLYSLGATNSSIKAQNHYFWTKSYGNKLENMKWFYSLGNITDRTIVRTFHNRCIPKSYSEYDNLPMIKWLAPLSDNCVLEIENGTIKNWFIKDIAYQALELLNEDDYDGALLKLGIPKESEKIVDMCSICHDTHLEILKLPCKHKYCLEGILQFYKVNNIPKKCFLCQEIYDLKNCVSIS